VLRGEKKPQRKMQLRNNNEGEEILLGWKGTGRKKGRVYVLEKKKSNCIKNQLGKLGSRLQQSVDKNQDCITWAEEGGWDVDTGGEKN